MTKRPRPAPGETRTLTIADRTDPVHPTTVTVTISAGCPRCGAALGQPTDVTVYDCYSGQDLTISAMVNPCGHNLLHRDVLKRAAATTGDPR